MAQMGPHSDPNPVQKGPNSGPHPGKPAELIRHPGFIPFDTCPGTHPHQQLAPDIPWDGPRY